MRWLDREEGTSPRRGLDDYSVPPGHVRLLRHLILGGAVGIGVEAFEPQLTRSDQAGFPPLGVQLFYSPEPPQLRLFDPPTRPYIPDKPIGGMWTSTYEEGIGSDWLRWLRGERMERRGGPGWLFTPDPTHRVYTIDQLGDLYELHHRYSVNLDPMGYFQTLDWVAVVRDFDAIHLTHKGLRDTRLAFPLGLYSWDCESTLWLRLPRFDDLRRR